jgi:hypothetical protein
VQSFAGIDSWVLDRQAKAEKVMNLKSRYADNPKVKIVPSNVPAEFRHLISLAKEWSICEDNELDMYIAWASEQKKSELIAAFGPHFAGLWKWHKACEHLAPQPDELVLFDAAANAAATVQSLQG